MPVMECRCGMLMSVATKSPAIKCIRCGNTRLSQLGGEQFAAAAAAGGNLAMFLDDGSLLPNLNRFQPVGIAGAADEGSHI
jgi:hypothetical protein